MVFGYRFYPYYVIKRIPQHNFPLPDMTCPHGMREDQGNPRMHQRLVMDL